MSGLMTNKLVQNKLTVKSCNFKLFLCSKASESLLTAQVCYTEHEHTAFIQNTAYFAQCLEQSVYVNVYENVK
jgi:hypothetical protein